MSENNFIPEPEDFYTANADAGGEKPKTQNRKWCDQRLGWNYGQWDDDVDADGDDFDYDYRDYRDYDDDAAEEAVAESYYTQTDFTIQVTGVISSDNWSQFGFSQDW